MSDKEILELQGLIELHLQKRGYVLVFQETIDDPHNSLIIYPAWLSKDQVLKNLDDSIETLKTQPQRRIL